MLKNGSRRLVLLTLFLGCVQFAAAQTADDIIEKHPGGARGTDCAQQLKVEIHEGYHHRVWWPYRSGRDPE